VQGVVGAVGRHLVVGLVTGGIAVGLAGCGTQRYEPASLEELPPAPAEQQKSGAEQDPAEQDEDSGPALQQVVVECASVGLPIPDGWEGEQTAEGTWTYRAPDEAGELTIDGEYREGAEALQDIAQLAAQLGWEDADTTTYGQNGIVIVGDAVAEGTEWHLGMVVGEANQIVNLTFEYDTSAEPTDEVEAARNDVAAMATGAQLASAGSCEGL
jgi:hypothetical protein